MQTNPRLPWRGLPSSHSRPQQLLAVSRRDAQPPLGAANAALPHGGDARLEHRHLRPRLGSGRAQAGLTTLAPASCAWQRDGHGQRAAPGYPRPFRKSPRRGTGFVVTEDVSFVTRTCGLPRSCGKKQTARAISRVVRAHARGARLRTLRTPAFLDSGSNSLRHHCCFAAT